MPTRTIELSAINVRLPAPHKAERYVALFEEAWKLKRSVKVHGDTSGMLGSVRQHKDEPNLIRGDLYRFVELQLTGEWLDLETGKAVDGTIVREIKIPSNLRPNFHYFPYIFFVKHHRLVFMSKKESNVTMTPLMVERMLRHLFEHKNIKKKFGAIDVTVEPERETLNRIFSAPRLKRIEITVTPPNPMGDVEEKLYARLEKLRAGIITEILHSRHPEGLRLDRDTKDLAKVAQSNGRVTATVADADGKATTLSTASHPLRVQASYDTQRSTAQHAFEAKSESVISEIQDR